MNLARKGSSSSVVFFGAMSEGKNPPAPVLPTDWPAGGLRGAPKRPAPGAPLDEGIGFAFLKKDMLFVLCERLNPLFAISSGIASKDGGALSSSSSLYPAERVILRAQGIVAK